MSNQNATYQVVMNHEGQYSIWPTYKPSPEGWEATGPSGPKQDCLAWIEEHWVDMRPRSLVRALQEAQATVVAPVPSPSQVEPPLVERLCAAPHGVRVARCQSAAEFRQQLERAYVLLEIPGTRGGTEIGLPIGRYDARTDELSFANGRGKVHTNGRINLDGYAIEVRAVIDLESLTGTGTFTEHVPAA